MPRILRSARLVLASHNPGKVTEIAALFRDFVEVSTATELGLPEPLEEAADFSAIALEKAHAAATATGLPALADDSGLVVHALGGNPGVRSARWGGPERDFAVAMRRVHDALGALPREAQMVTALALAWPDGHGEAFEGRVPGRVVWPPRGALGFGYEPMFVPEGSTRTYGEMPRAEKHLDDPRARAFDALRAACLEERSTEASQG